MIRKDGSALSELRERDAFQRDAIQRQPNEMPSSRGSSQTTRHVIESGCP
jgi:hypothetical protein